MTNSCGAFVSGVRKSLRTIILVRSRPNHLKKHGGDFSDMISGSDLCFGPVQNEPLVVRTYGHWPLRASGLLDLLARLANRVKKSRRASGPAVNVEACFNLIEHGIYWYRTSHGVNIAVTFNILFLVFAVINLHIFQFTDM